MQDFDFYSALLDNLDLPFEIEEVIKVENHDGDLIILLNNGAIYTARLSKHGTLALFQPGWAIEK